MKQKLSLEPYKGTRDFYPQDQFIQNYIFSVWRKVVESYGYLEYGASILEETELYKAKSGEEIVNDQTYSFMDRGDRHVTIRPEMTPTVARMVAAKRRELSFPLRWYSIPNLFRYERPQRGRLREHWQLNVDMFGVDTIEADIEMISLAYDIMKAFGAKDENFEIRINSRKILNAIAKIHEIPVEQEFKITRLLDKFEKIGPEKFEEGLVEILGSVELAKKFKADLHALDNMKERSELRKELMEDIHIKSIGESVTKLAAKGISNVKFRSTLARGFDYYTGTVFEMFDTSPKNPRALFGGGRYDDLVGIFGVEPVSGVGFGWGDVTTRDFLETYDLLPEYHPPIQLYICHLENYLSAAEELASDLRKQGLNIAVDLTDRKVAAQVKTADKDKIPHILVVGEEEVKSGKYKVKSLRESREEVVDKNEIGKYIVKK